MIRKWKKFPFSWLLPVLFFAALWLLGTTGIYNDSNQYIAMHIHREPLYSFFLWIFRSLFGETKYLDIVRWCIQDSGEQLYPPCCYPYFCLWYADR